MAAFLDGYIHIDVMTDRRPYSDGYFCGDDAR
jgi:hypothetical protein